MKKQLRNKKKTIIDEGGGDGYNNKYKEVLYQGISIRLVQCSTESQHGAFMVSYDLHVMSRACCAAM